jgi:4'-phosphopantetheinyl transferase EntD
MPENPIWPQVRWLDQHAVLVLDLIGADGESLSSVERGIAVAMSTARRREFTGGRTAARHALGLLRYPSDNGIAMGMAGEPIWPTGVVGSLSHTTRHAAALVGRSLRYVSLGVDLDDGRPLGTAASADLMTDSEVAVVLAQGWTDDLAIAQNIAFLAKEALFKYQYPLTHRRDLDFDEVRLHTGDHIGVLGASAAAPEDLELQTHLATVRIFHEVIQGLRLCWVLPSA